MTLGLTTSVYAPIADLGYFFAENSGSVNENFLYKDIIVKNLEFGSTKLYTVKNSI
jgi:hypothetical protein